MQWIPEEKKEQPEQEPDDLTIAYMAGFYDGKNKYAPQREWVGLTDEEIDSVNCVEKLYIGEGDSVVDPETVHEFARFIEAKLREKNT